MKTYLTLLFALLLLCTGAGAALASTPDGQTPSEETVCDNETGAAYGLCNAYCEAMDCETDNPHASANACSRVQAKFQQITGRDLPCEEVVPVTCPCDDGSSVFSQVLAGTAPVSSCQTEPSSGLVDGITLSYFIFTSPVAYAGQLADGSGVCSSLFGGTLSITAAEGLYCAQLLEQEANARNLTCVAP